MEATDAVIKLEGEEAFAEGNEGKPEKGQRPSWHYRYYEKRGNQ